MKTFINRCAQGDVMLVRISSIPSNAKLAMPDARGFYVVTKSETHHDHIVKANKGVKLYTSDDPMISYLEVIEATDEAETLLTHLRTFDTHETIKIPVGKFEVRRQREYTLQGFRRAAD